ncbi:MAG TPA: hypothetical protein VHE37_07465 [Nevskiaceae bacterium]|nr:hypothetical protein [Nevskiaceae bacterium]
MDRINSANMAAGRKFQDADPGSGRQATFFNAAFFNSVQEELAGIVETADLELDPDDNAQVLKALKLLMYPVGSIYITSDPDFLPETYFGGTWSKVAVGRVPVGLDAGQTEFDTVGKQGGEKTHTLTVSELPSLQFSIPIGNANDTALGAAEGQSSNSGSLNTNSLGGGQPHNNLSPYEVIGNIWKRTA